MKKILYTLLVGLVIVSCDKNDLNEGASASSINVLEQAEEVNSADLGFDLEALVDRLTAAAVKAPLKASSLTGKDANVGDYITIKTSNGSGFFYEFVFSNDVTACDPSSLTFEPEAYIVLLADNTSSIKIGSPGADGIEIATLPASLSFLYGITYNYGKKINDNGTAADLTITGTVVAG